MGTAALVRPAGRRSPEPAYSYRRPSWFGAGRRGAPGGARGGRVLRPLLVRDLRRRRTGRAGGAAAPLHGRRRHSHRGSGHLHPRSQRAWWHRARRDRPAPARTRSSPSSCPSYSQRKAWWWLRRAASGRSCTVTDTTSGTAVLHVAGPASQDLLAAPDPRGRLRRGAAPLHLPRPGGRGRRRARRPGLVHRQPRLRDLRRAATTQSGVFEAVLVAGADLGLRLAGLHALDSLRSEVGYRHLGHDIGPDDTPSSAGLGRFVAERKDFVGKEALLTHGEPGVARSSWRSTSPSRPSGTASPSGSTAARSVTSRAAPYGHTLGAAVGLATLDPAVVAALGVGEPTSGDPRRAGHLGPRTGLPRAVPLGHRLRVGQRTSCTARRRPRAR